MTALITRRNLLALLLAVVFACSVFTVSVFASEETTTPVAEETTEPTEETTAGEETSEGATTEAATESGTAEETTTEEETTLNFWQENFTRVNSDKEKGIHTV